MANETASTFPSARGDVLCRVAPALKRNNSITEALTFGVSMLALPFSTDQFDGAAAIERKMAGLALDPNTAPSPLIGETVRRLLRTPPPISKIFGVRLRSLTGPDATYAAMARLDGTAPAFPDPLLPVSVASS